MKDLSHITSLYRRGASEPEAWKCELCTQVHRAQALAIQCCKPWECPTCGRTIRGGSMCSPCWQTKQAATRQKLYDEATKIPVAEYQKPLFAPASDEFFDDPEMAEEWLSEHPDAPRWFFGSYFVSVSLDPADMMEIAAGDDHHEDARATDAGLTEFIGRWNEQQTDGTWHEDTSVVVVFDERETLCSR